MYCDHSRKYRSMYETYTNERDMAGYATDVFEKKCKGKSYNFNTLKETRNNYLLTLGRPPLISCEAGSEKDGKIYCPPVGDYVAAEQCPMYQKCKKKCNHKNCESCVKKHCLKNHECEPLCQSRAGGLIVNDKSKCSTCRHNVAKKDNFKESYISAPAMCTDDSCPNCGCNNKCTPKQPWCNCTQGNSQNHGTCTCSSKNTCVQALGRTRVGPGHRAHPSPGGCSSVNCFR